MQALRFGTIHILTAKQVEARKLILDAEISGRTYSRRMGKLLSEPETDFVKPHHYFFSPISQGREVVFTNYQDNALTRFWEWFGRNLSPAMQALREQGKTLSHVAHEFEAHEDPSKNTMLKVEEFIRLAEAPESGLIIKRHVDTEG